MREAKIVVDMIEGQLLVDAVLTLAQRGDPPSHRRHMLADAQVDALDEGGLDLPAVRRKHLLDGLEGAEHDAMRYGDQVPVPYGLDDLRIEQVGLWHPARLGRWTLRLPARWLHPLPIVGQQGRQIRAKAIREKQWSTVGR